MTKQNNKPWYKSKTIWGNVLVCAAGISLAISDYIGTGGTITIVGLLNILLRSITDSKLSSN